MVAEPDSQMPFDDNASNGSPKPLARILFPEDSKEVVSLETPPKATACDRPVARPLTAENAKPTIEDVEIGDASQAAAAAPAFITRREQLQLHAKPKSKPAAKPPLADEVEEDSKPKKATATAKATAKVKASAKGKPKAKAKGKAAAKAKASDMKENQPPSKKRPADTEEPADGDEPGKLPAGALPAGCEADLDVPEGLLARPDRRKKASRAKEAPLQAEAAAARGNKPFSQLSVSDVMDILHADDLKMRIVLDLLKALEKTDVPCKENQIGLPQYTHWQLSVYWTRGSVGIIRKTGGSNVYVGTLACGNSNNIAVALESLDHYVP